MMADPTFFLLLLVAGALAAAFVIGAVGFADALIMNAVWLHIMEPAKAIPLVVVCGLFMHIIPLITLRNTLDYSRLPPFIGFGLLAVPIGVGALNFVSPEYFRALIAIVLVVYGLWMLARPNLTIGEAGGKIADGAVGFVGGFLGGFAGLSGLAPTLWAGLRGWPKDTQRGVFQPFVLFMHAVAIVVFLFTGMISGDTLNNLMWCLPAIALGSWLGVKLYPFLNEQLFKRVILALILLSGISLLAG